jgi:hypothetical protein
MHSIGCNVRWADGELIAVADGQWLAIVVPTQWRVKAARSDDCSDGVFPDA